MICIVGFFFSSRRRHTRCALVTGVQTCALPIYTIGDDGRNYIERMQNASARMQKLIDDLLTFSRISRTQEPFEPVDFNKVVHEVLNDLERSEERRVGKECVSTCRSRWSPYH